jgi:RimJ/RimL family protein N-acetyltransferase
MTLSGESLRTFPATVEADRVVLVESDPAFAAAFAAAMRASYDSLEFVSDWRAAVDVDVAARSLAVSRERSDQEVVRHAFLRDTGAYVARIDLSGWDFATPRCELGYLGDSRVAGQGLVREAALAMLDVAWSLGVERVQALVDGRNHRAVRFATGLGMTREGVLRHYERDDDGALCDQVVFAGLNPMTSRHTPG